MLLAYLDQPPSLFYLINYLAIRLCEIYVWQLYARDLRCGCKRLVCRRTTKTDEVMGESPQTCRVDRHGCCIWFTFLKATAIRLLVSKCTFCYCVSWRPGVYEMCSLSNAEPGFSFYLERLTKTTKCVISGSKISMWRRNCCCTSTFRPVLF